MGLVATQSPGSIIAIMTVTPSGDPMGVLLGTCSVNPVVA